MSLRADTTHVIAGALVASRYAGLGVPGSAIPAGSPLDNDSGKLADSEYRLELGTIPAGVSVYVYDDMSIEATGDDGTYVIPTTVYEDGQVYGTPDLTLSFGLTAVTSDLVVSYAVHAPVAADLAASYAVLQPVVADLACSYAVHAPVSVALAASYAVHAPVSADLAVAYAVHQRVSADLACSYAVLAGATVVADLACSYAVHAPVSADLAGSYAVHQAVLAELAAGYAVHALVVADLEASYAVRAQVLADLACSYAVLSLSSGASAAQIWAYVLPNGKTAGQTLAELHEYARDLYRIHGLDLGVDLVVTPTSRTAGTIEQTVATAGEQVTVTRH